MNTRQTSEQREETARAMYARYNESRGGLTWDGKPIPAWEELSGETGEGVKEGWRCAGDEALAIFGARIERQGRLVIDLSDVQAPTEDIAEILRSTTTDLSTEDASVIAALADAFDLAEDDPNDRECHSCEAAPGTPCATDCGASDASVSNAEYQRCVGLLDRPIPNLDLRSPLEVYDMMRGRLSANPPSRDP